MRSRLGVNVDHVATVRQARKAAYPDPVEASLLAERAGADQITVHLREDRRHIQERDVEVLRRVVKTELNLEMAATTEMVTLALKYSPDTVTLVPERREEITTEGGLDVVAGKDHLQRVIRLLKDGNIRVSLFIDPDLDQVRAAHKLDAHAIEIHTGRYSESRSFKERSDELMRIRDSAKAAAKLGLGVAAGHGLHYQNVIPVARIAEIVELNIGHSIVARALMTGMEAAVKDMVELLKEAALAKT
ncbi:MAG: pyridoxine 5'-phosphate synthase [Deltaproteobacteria bacterium]|jgi:pyridoxine 5-phosphate synthase|nr:pyridoxine 5'-phosphate synthase [Deltaproteobacteria bacterium]